MHATTVILLGLGLAVDSTLAALALGLRSGRTPLRTALRVGATFGGVHGALTMLGWFVGENVAAWFAAVDHWVAFAVLALLGARALMEAWRDKAEDERELAHSAVWIAAVATSLDGVAVGFGLAVASEPAGWVAASAAAATMLGATLSFRAGRHVPRGWRRAAQVAAGLVLIGIGASILREHLSE